MKRKETGRLIRVTHERFSLYYFNVILAFVKAASPRVRPVVSGGIIGAMRIVIAGSGAVGGYYGGKLAHAGHEVFFIARGAHLAAIRERGLTIRSIDGDFTVHPAAGETSADFGVADLVIVAVKTYDTASALELFAPSVGPETRVVSLQNGVDSEATLARRFGADAVVGGIAFIGAALEEPGVVNHISFGRAMVGPWTEASVAAATRIKEAFEEAGVRCKVSDNIVNDLWGKMLWNVGFNAVCALADLPTTKTTAYPPTLELSRAAMTEMVRVAEAKGIALTDEMVEKNLTLTATGGAVYPSTLQDLRAGRRLEVDIFNGRVSALGRELGIPTPANDALSALTGIRNWIADGG
jgi:2-dehydropantoate 2-reductase